MRVLVFGNSGSGKSTFARRLSSRHNLKMLDLDRVVWSRSEFAKFRLDEEIIRELDAFVAANPSWVVEGCYGRWMEYLQSHCTRMVFLNSGEAACLANCRTRPWEPKNSLPPRPKSSSRPGAVAKGYRRRPAARTTVNRAGRPVYSQARRLRYSVLDPGTRSD